MSKLKILYGEHKQALLDACLDQISEHNNLWPDRRAFLIVPETAKADTERRFFSRPDNKGLLMAEVLSFRRFAYRLFAEAGGLATDHISPMGRIMLIQSLLREHRNIFKRFGRFADKPGYAAGIDSVIGDFRRYGINSEDLERAAAETDNQLLSDKLSDFAMLSSSFDQKLIKLELGDHSLELDELRELLVKAPARLEFLRASSIWIYGFGESRDFTAQEHKLIDELVNCCDQVYITVCADSVPGDNQLILSGSTVFLHGRQTASHLAEKRAVSISRVDSARQAPFEALAGWLGHDIRPEADELAKAITLMRAEDKKQELYYVAGEIRRLIVEEKYRYRDIAIAVCDLPAWQFMLQTVFREFGLDSFIDDEMPLSGTVLMRYVNSLLQLGRSGDRFENMMALLRTGLTDAPEQAIDQYENYCLALGLPERGRYRENRYYTDRYTGQAEALAFKHTFIDPLLDFAKSISASASVQERVQSLTQYLTEGSTVLSNAEKLTFKWDAEGENHAAAALVQAWNSLIDLLAEMKMIFSDQKISLESFTSILLAGMSGSFSRIIPTGIDRIRISDISKMSQYFPKVLFVVGATRNSLPTGHGTEGMLMNRERQQLEQLSGKAFPDMERYHITAKGNEVYTLLTSPSDRLYLSCPSLQDSPSIYQQRLYSLLRKEIVLKSDCEIDIRWNSPLRASRLCRIIDGNSESLLSDQNDIIAIRKVLEDSGKYSCQRDSKSIEPLDPQAPESIVIKPELVLSQYKNELITSVSRIQKYQECPYSHYASYLLGLRERDTNLQDHRMSGTILHALIERAFADLIKRMKQSGNIESSRLEFDRWRSGINAKYITELCRQDNKPADDDYIDFKQLEQTGAGRILRRLVLNAVRTAAQQLAPDEYLPGYLEWEFPSHQSFGLTLRASSRKLILRGKIDRVDMHADGKHYRIIDYKSGSTEFNLEAVYHGLNLQLPIYLQAFIENNQMLEPGNMGYFYFRKPIYTSSKSFAIPDDKAIVERSLREKWTSWSDCSSEDLKTIGEYSVVKAADIAEHIFTGNVSAKPQCLNVKSSPCQWCEYKVLCNYDDRTAARRIIALDETVVPDSYPGYDKMKESERKAVRRDYIEELMVNYIGNHQQSMDQGE